MLSELQKGSIMERSRKYHLNTALTGVDDEGKWQEDDHFDKVKSLRALIMKNDGVTKCYVARYEIEVWYLDNVTNSSALLTIVQDAVDTSVGNPGLFPYRGYKPPVVSLTDGKPEEPSPFKSIVVRYSSAIVAFPVSRHFSDGFDQEEFENLTREVVEQMVKFDGCTGFDFKLRTASVSFDSRYSTEEQVVDHLTRVFHEALTEHGFFPFQTDKDLELDFKVS
jgi:hypothetical protein